MPKLIVIYPYPSNVEEFENAYTNEHIPLAFEKIKGMSKFVASRVVATPDGSQPAFYRLAELHFPSMSFPSMSALQETAASAGLQEAAAHAISISSGGPPYFLVAEEETTEF
jgi:uncharacterized protein (TIGR02118 family)